MSIVSGTAGVLTGATNLLLGTSFRTPTIKDFSIFGDSKKAAAKKENTKTTKPAKQKESGDLPKKELAEIGEILGDISKSLNAYLAASAVIPQTLLDMQAERKRSADFLSGMVDGMRAEMIETGQEGNESLNEFLDGFSESIREFVESSAFLPKLQTSTEDLADSIQNLTEAQEETNRPDSRLEEIEHERENEQVEEKRHNKLMDVLLTIATLGFLHSKSKKKEGEEGGSSSFFGGLLGGKLGAMFGKGAIMGLILAFGKFALVIAGIGLLIAGLSAAFGFFKLMIEDPEKFKELFGDAEYWKEKLMGALSWVGDALWGALTWVGEKIMELGAAFRNWLYTGPLLGGDSLSIKDIVEKLSDLFSWETIKESFDTAVAITKNKFNELKAGFVKKYEEIKESISSTFQSIRDSIGETIESIKISVKDIVDKVVTKFDEVKEKVIGIYNSIVEGIMEKIDSIKEGFTEFKERLQSKFEEFKKSISEFFDPEMWKQKALEGIAGAKEEIGRIFDESMAKVQEFIGESGKRISEFFEGIVETIQLIFGDISKLIGGAKDAVLALGKSLFSKDKENEADTNIKIIEEEDTKLKERIRVLSRSGGRAGESQEQKERKRAEIEKIEKQREELKAARDYQESTHKKSLNNIDKQLETATGIDKEELLAQRERIVAASKEDARIAVGEILDRTKIESIAQVDPIDLIEEKPERRRGGRSTAKTQIEAIENDESEQLEPETPKKQSRRSRRSAKDQEPEIKTDSDLIVIEKPSEIDPLFISPARSPIEKLDPAKDPNSLYSQMMEESAISMTDAAAKDAAAIISGSSSVSIDSTLREQKQITQSSTTSVSTVTVAPIFARGILPGISMNQ